MKHKPMRKKKERTIRIVIMIIKITFWVIINFPFDFWN